MRKSYLTIPILLFAQLSTSITANAETRVILSSEVKPGVYGRIEYGGSPLPPLVYERPVTIYRQPQPVQTQRPAQIQQPVQTQQTVQSPQPVYLHVPPGHAKDWGKHCRKYNACGSAVYFVKSTEYEGKKPKKEKKEKKDKD